MTSLCRAHRLSYIGDTCPGCRADSERAAKVERYTKRIEAKAKAEAFEDAAKMCEERASELEAIDANSLRELAEDMRAMKPKAKP
jgi:hypothetical protein